MLNKVKQGSQMYQFLNEDSRGNGYTWNVIKGKCPHDCSYCYMKKYPQPELHFDEKELKTDLGSGNFIFVGSSCDMWTDGIPFQQIQRILDHCIEYRLNSYLFQSKNTKRFPEFEYFWKELPDFVLGTTIETNYHYKAMGNAPGTYYRMLAMITLNARKMVSIEPIVDFNLPEMIKLIRDIKPEFVSIGANTNWKVKLPEPPPEKVIALIDNLRQFTEVKVKDNLKRIVG